MRYAAALAVLTLCTCAFAQPDTKAEQDALKAKEDAALNLAAAAKRIGRADAEAKANAEAAEYRRQRLAIEVEEKRLADEAEEAAKRREQEEQSRREAESRAATDAALASAGEIALLALPWLAGLSVLFLPTVVALLRRHPSGIAIFALNLLVGWTCIGWVVALVWSLAAIEADTRYR
jgi:hypothetical protein